MKGILEFDLNDFESTLNKNLKIARQNVERQQQEHIKKRQQQEHIKELMEEYETKKYLHMVTDHSLTTDNIYTGTPDSFEDVNPQQEQALYREEKTPDTF